MAYKGITKLDDRDVRDIEPYCNAIQGIWVPQAGIVDYRQVANSLPSLSCIKEEISSPGLMFNSCARKMTGLRFTLPIAKLKVDM
jgi:L-2-hydroxyglutarate oxidase